jgi:5'-deoxynucleotidase YfbR-like HD superfamily hydrolase
MLHDITRGNDYIQTWKSSFWPLDPREEDIDIETIAHALSNLCRFGGHCKEFYSVAQHCVECTKIVFESGKYSNEECLQTLLHDASEAYIVDVPRPIKKLLPEYSVMEDNIQRTIYRKFGLPEEMPQVVKIVDNTMLVTEASQLLYETNGWWKQDNWPKPYLINIHPMKPIKAAHEFMCLFKQLGGDK